METNPVNPANQANTANLVSSKKKILLVEDEAFLSSLLELKLSQEGFQVEKAMDGEEAFNMLEVFMPDLILLDLILPKRNGFEFLEMIRNDPRFSKIPVIITSNLGQDSDIERGKTFGVIEYIIKNKLSIDELVSKVSQEVKKLV
ncbi:MAG: response regulator [Candidatus Paceibacterota bacterium]|jgi:DNA-binding response OmpR family regulator|nr:response regulator [Candidatus Paceibacterota bacterium]